MRVFRPLPHQLPFFTTNASERILRGGNRSGKSVCAACLFASAVTGQPIIGPDEKPLPRHFNKIDERFLAWVIGWDLKHIGMTIYRLLFEPGLFRVIWEEKESRYRLWNPADPSDVARIKEAEYTDPLIPSRFIDQDTWAFVKAAERQFISVRLKNGAKVCAFPSTARQAKQGDACDLIWIDEDIAYAKHIKEYQMRLSDRKGKLIWSVWPHSANAALVDMSNRAEKHKDTSKPMVHETIIRFSDNPYIDPEEKEKTWDRLDSEEERRSRDYGEFMFDLVRMYDFDQAKHCLFDLNTEKIKAAQYADEFWNVFWTEHRKFPADWTRYLALDPSHTRTAVLIGVVPPPFITIDNKEVSTDDVVFVEREIVLKRKTAEECAQTILEVTGDQRFEAFIIDCNMGRMTAVGFGKTVKQQYTEAFAKMGLKSRMTIHGFMDGMNETAARREFVRDRLRPLGGGMPRLRIVYENCHETIEEFKTFKKRVVDTKEGREFHDEAAKPRLYDCMAALEYLISYKGLMYVDPREYDAGGSPAYRRAMRILAKHRAAHSEYVHLGPGEKAAI